jgi:L,D-peptidoglycan transpeptidase YkuD (ErfK/YbiS/YcfS/YnhG family)
VVTFGKPEDSEAGSSTSITSSPYHEASVSPMPSPAPQNNGLGFIFEETSETVYATVNVRIRSSCTTEADNTVALLQKGEAIERIGFHTEWSKVIYQGTECYIKSDFLSLDKPSGTDNTEEPPVTAKPVITDTPLVTVTPSVTLPPADSQKDASTDTTSKDDFVTRLKITADIRQLVCVIGEGGADCTVSFHSKDADGIWTEQFSASGECGSKGISYQKKEGDKKTPAGLYSFTTAFGIKADPGANLPYRKITDYDYWIDDVKSPYYNTWVNSREIPGDYTSEHLIEHSPQYNYALNINYNPDCTPGAGCAIFLHGLNGLGHTTGCIAVSEKYVKNLVQELNSSAMILIIPDKDDLKNYE